MRWIKKKKCDVCSKEQRCSECKEYQDRSFELEVDEELQQERLAKWWKKYSWLVYGGVIAILLVTAVTEWYRSYQMKVRLSESDAFEVATLLAHEGKNEEAIVAFENLAKSGKTGYRILALMNLADLQMGSNKRNESLATWKKVLDTTSKKDPLHLTASLAYVGYQLEDGEPEKLLKVLEPALENDAFQALATELAVPLLNKQGRKDEALKLIQKAIQNPMASAGSKSRLNSLKGE